jgi:hypothetical protein
MKRRLPVLSVSLALLFTAATNCRADPAFSITSNAPDLTNLSVGQDVTFNVVLSGLAAGQSVDFLAATVDFDATLLGTPNSVNPGAIVPDSAAFFGAPSSGQADAFYDDSLSLLDTPITQNGIFYSFDTTVQAAGSGMLAFESASAQVGAPGSAMDVSIDSTFTLSFNAGGQSTVVPEPRTAWFFMVGLAGIVGPVLMRGRRRPA